MMTLDEKDLFLDRLTPDFKDLLFKIFYEVLNEEGVRVLKINLSDEGSERTLIQEKLRAEGSARFVRRLSAVFESLNKPSGDVITGGKDVRTRV